MKGNKGRVLLFVALDGLSKAELRQQIERDLEELGLFLTTERPANTNRGNGSVS